MLYLILSKATFQPVYLRVESPRSHPLGQRNQQWWWYKCLGQVALTATIGWGWRQVLDSDIGTYTGLILIWAAPFLLLLWLVDFVLQLIRTLILVQEPGIPIHPRVAIVKYVLAHRHTNSISLGC